MNPTPAGSTSVAAQASAVHIYRAALQPATRFVDRCAGKPHWFRCSPRKLWWTDCCRKRRWAKYVQVGVYYDCIRRLCAEGHGCKVKR